MGPLQNLGSNLGQVGTGLRFRAIASDYDRTLANEGLVAPGTVDVLRRARASGLKIILITGRVLEELRALFPELSLFDLVVAENGALLYDPHSGSEEPLCDPASEIFLQALRDSGIPFAVGRRVVATVRPHEKAVLELVNRLNVELQITFNRESVMILPSGIDKGSGLTAALTKLEISAAEVLGIGDAENDWAFLCLSGYSVVVANAVASLKKQVDFVTRSRFGAGAAEVIERVIAGADLP